MRFLKQALLFLKLELLGYKGVKCGIKHLILYLPILTHPVSVISKLETFRSL